MKKFLLALIISFAVTAGNFVEAAQFTQEQFDQIVSMTVQNPAVEKNSTLPVNASTFQTNYNDFMSGFIKESNATAEDVTKLEQLLLINDPKIFSNDDNRLFTQNFSNEIVITGLGKENSNFKVMNFFAMKAEDQNTAIIYLLILRGFVKGIAPDYDATTLLETIEKNPNAPVIHNGITFTVSSVDNMNIVTAVVN